MTFNEIYHKYGHNTAVAIAHIIFTDNESIYIPKSKGQIRAFFKGKRCKRIDIQLPDIDNVLEMVSRLNKEVKHPTCPNNLRNRFYSKKKIFIQNLLHKELVDKIIESDRYYNFIVGEYSFHQPKVYFPDGIKDIDGTEVYEPIVPEIPFSMDDYKNTMIGMVYFMCL